MNLIRYAVAFVLALVLAAPAFAELKERDNVPNRNGDHWQRVRVIMKDAPRSTGLDTIVDTERDTSNETYSFPGADNVRLFTHTRELTASDTVFVNALIVNPWDTTGYVTVALDTILTVGANDNKDVGSLVNTYTKFKVELVGGNTGSEDSAEVQMSFDVLWKSR